MTKRYKGIFIFLGPFEHLYNISWFTLKEINVLVFVLPRLLSCEQILHKATEMGRVTKDTNSVIPRKTTPKVWKYFGDNLDGVKVYCLTCRDEKNINSCLKISDGSTKPLR